MVSSASFPMKYLNNSVNMVESGHRGRYEEAQELHYKLFELMRINFIESNPMPVKTALSMMGMMSEDFRLP